jgi:sigma-B regulation protein RsbU (phosphoserine phosphatase)
VAELPVVFQYQRALDEFRREGREPPLLKRMSELISLLDLTTTLSSSLSSDEILNAALLIVMGEMQAGRGALFVREEGGAYQAQAARGLPSAGPWRLSDEVAPGEPVLLRGCGRFQDTFETLGLEVLCPIEKAGRVIAVLGLGPRADGRKYAGEDSGFLRSVAACAATPIENGLIYGELRKLNQRLSLKVFQLHNLFDISRELTASFDDETIKNLVASTLMGHLMVSRCALYLGFEGGLTLAHARGLRGGEESALIPEEVARPVLDILRAATLVTELPEGPLRDRLLRTRMALAVPLYIGGRPPEGLMTVGERLSGAPFTEEDREYALTLGRQAMAAIESVRLHRVQVEKQRQDRELQIAREIQQSLFPSVCPSVSGFDVAAASRACFQVGGDHYDFIPLVDGCLALAIADVSGKGTPASILMASVHASLRALAGSAPPERLMARLNAFLYESTQSNKFVTLFYAELDPARSRLAYVNAGHVPPFLVRGDGRVERLEAGGPVLGLLEGAAFEAGEVSLDPGDLVAMVTDGATEALSPDDTEFGDERVAQALCRAAAGASGEALAALVAEIDCWTGPRGCSDDLTILILKAQKA